MKTINIISDVAGRFDELMELLAKMPPADLVLGVGDLIDRGPKSREVVEWFMGDPLSRESLFANHELMCLAAHRNNPMQPMGHPYWPRNGGAQTMQSYNWAPMPESHLKWFEERPAWFRQDGLFVSHAPVRDVNQLPLQYGFDWQLWAHRADMGDESGWVWNRHLSNKPMPGEFMVYGHNSWSFGPSHYIDEQGVMSQYAFCIDNSRHKELSGMHWPTRELFSVEYN